MKRLLSLLLLMLATVSQAVENHTLHYLHIDVCLYKDGSARVTERRTCTIGNQGTEGFITMKNMGDIHVNNLQVRDEQGIQYIVDSGDWETERTRQQKRGHCGVHRISGGVELCWGIGDSGLRTYEISYTLTNLVKSYPDYDGFNHSFYEAANTPAQSATLTLRMVDGALNWPQSRIWAFGFIGNATIENGRIAASSSQCLDDGDCFIMMAQFDKGLFQPSCKGEGYFASIRAKALEGSDYPPYIEGESLRNTPEIGNRKSSLTGGQGYSGLKPGSSKPTIKERLLNKLFSVEGLSLVTTIIIVAIMLIRIYFFDSGIEGPGRISSYNRGYNSNYSDDDDDDDDYGSRSSGGGGSSSRSGGGGHSGGGGSGFRTIALLLALSLCLSATAENKEKKPKVEGLEILERLIPLSNSRWPDLPKIISTDQKTYDYCDKILSRTDEQYSQDTALINARLDTLSWIHNHQIVLDPSLPNAPEPLGGPPSWYFRCVLEGGTILTQSASSQPPFGCIAITDYLRSILVKKWETEQKTKASL